MHVRRVRAREGAAARMGARVVGLTGGARWCCSSIAVECSAEVDCDAGPAAVRGSAGDVQVIASCRRVSAQHTASWTVMEGGGDATPTVSTLSICPHLPLHLLADRPQRSCSSSCTTRSHPS